MLEFPEGAWVRVDPDMLSVGDRVRSVVSGHEPHRQSDGIVTDVHRDTSVVGGTLDLRDAHGYPRHFWLRSMSDWWRLREMP